MSHTRQEKIGSSLRGELARIIQGEMNDPRLGFVTVTAVEVSAVRRVARVFVSTLGVPAEGEQMVAALERAQGFLRHRLADNLALRRIPELRFSLDSTAIRGERIERLLHELDLADGKGNGPHGEPD